MTIRKDVLQAAAIFEERFPQAEKSGPVIYETDRSGFDEGTGTGVKRQTELILGPGKGKATLAQNTEFYHPDSITHVEVALHTHAPHGNHPRRQGQVELKIWGTYPPTLTPTLEMDGNGRILSIRTGDFTVIFERGRRISVGDMEIEMPKVGELAERILDRKPAVEVTFRE